MTMYDVEDDVADRPAVNPFRNTWYHQVMGKGFWLFDAARYWLSRPFVLASRRLGAVVSYAMWRLDGAVVRGRELLQGAWWMVLDFLRIEGFRHQVHSLQETAARSVGDLTHSMQERTIHANWLRLLFHRLQTVRMPLQMRWIGFLEWTEQSAITRVLSAPLRLFTWLVFAIGDFCQEWLWTREFRHLLYGIPAMVLLMPLVYCAARMPFYSNQLKSKHYQLAAEAAIKRGRLCRCRFVFSQIGSIG